MHTQFEVDSVCPWSATDLGADLSGTGGFAPETGKGAKWPSVERSPQRSRYKCGVGVYLLALVVAYIGPASNVLGQAGFTDTERWIVAQITSQRSADVSDRTASERLVSAELIRLLLEGHVGVPNWTLTGAIVLEPVCLEYATLPSAFTFVACEFYSSFSLGACTLKGGAVFVGCHFMFGEFQQITALRSLVISECTFRYAPDFQAAQIAHSFELRHCIVGGIDALLGPKQSWAQPLVFRDTCDLNQEARLVARTSWLSQMNVGENVVLDGTYFEYPVRLHDSRVGGHLYAADVTFRASVALARARIGSLLDLSGSEFNGRVSFEGLSAARDLDLRRAKFGASGLALRDASVEGALLLDGAAAAQLRLERCRLHDLRARDFKGTQVRIATCTIDGDLLLGGFDRRASRRSVWLRNVTVAGRIDMRSANISLLRVQDSVLGMFSVTESRANRIRVTQCKVGHLRMEVPNAALSGLEFADVEFEAFSHNGGSWDDVLRMFERATCDVPTYEQLASFCHRRGMTTALADTRIAQRRRARASETSGVARIKDFAYEKCLGYGFKPEPILFALVGLIGLVAGLIWYWRLESSWSAVLLAVDVVLPADLRLLDKHGDSVVLEDKRRWIAVARLAAWIIFGVWIRHLLK